MGATAQDVNIKTTAVVLILTSCAVAPTFQTQSTYDRDQVSWSFEEGTGKIEGDGFLMRRDGMLVKCAGQRVGLVPVSEYSIERFTFIYGTPNGGYNTAVLYPPLGVP